jgi:putative inorganic carbon (HCO3(-)) transporter
MLRSLFVVLLVLTGFSAMAVSPLGGLLFYLWYAMFRPEAWVYFDLATFRLSWIVGILFILSSFIRGIVPLTRHPLCKAMIAFLATTLLSQLNAIDPENGWNWILYLAKLILICLMVVRLVNTPQRFVLVVGVISASFGFHTATAGAVSLLGGGLRFAEGAAGAFVDNNGYALGTVMIIPLLIATGQNLPFAIGPRWKRLGKGLGKILYLAALLSAYTVVSTFSRGGLLGLIAMTGSLFSLQRRRLLFLGLAAVMLTMLPLVPLPEGWTDRMHTIETYEEVQEESALSRIHFWRVAVDMARAHPFFGIGLRNYDATYDNYDFSYGTYGSHRSVHSSHLQVLAETGFVGGGFYLFLLFYSILVAFRVRSRSKIQSIPNELQNFLRTSSNAMMASILGFVVGGAFIALSINDLTWLIFALIAALDLISKSMVLNAGTGTTSICASELPTKKLEESTLQTVWCK